MQQDTAGLRGRRYLKFTFVGVGTGGTGYARHTRRSVDYIQGANGYISWLWRRRPTPKQSTVSRTQGMPPPRTDMQNQVEDAA